MSDNKNISIQDRGWKEMQFLLDRELPLEKKKRRLLPWFILGAFAIAILGFIGISGYLNVDPNSKITTSSESLKNTKNTSQEKNIIDKNVNGLGIVEDASIASNEVTATNEANATKEIAATTEAIAGKNRDVHSIKADNQEQIKGDISQVKSIIENSILDKKESSSIQIGKQLNEPFIFNDNNLLPGIINGISTNSGIDKNREVLDSEKTLNKEESKSSKLGNQLPANPPLENRSVLPSVLKLPITIPFLDNQIEKENFNSMKPIVFAQSFTALSPYIFIAGNYQGSINGLGYEFGGGLDYKRNNIGIYFEVGYARTKYDNGEVADDFAPDGAVIEVNGGAIEDVGVGSNPSEFDLNVANFAKITSSIKELTFDLGLKYSISKKINLDFGLAYSRLLSATNKSLSINFEAANMFNEKSYSLGASELYNKGAYSTFDLSPHIGLEYYFLSNASLSLNYRHGLKNLIANTDLDKLNSLQINESIYRRKIEAKLRYYF